MNQKPKSAMVMPCPDFRRLGMSRRATLRAGALALTGMSLPRLLLAQQSVQEGAAQSFGRAKSCILIFLWGGPSQLDTWDPKPNAPEDIRGPFRPISTTVPGISIGEHFPLLSRQVHRLSIVRSMNHDDPAHLSTAHRLLTGHLAPTPNSDSAGPSPRDWPHMGALVAKLRPTKSAVPSAVNMPWTVMHPAAPGGRAPGQDAGWLGKAYDPFHIDGDPNDATFHVEGLGLPDGISSGRLAFRRELLEQLAGAAGLSGRWTRILGRLPAEITRCSGFSRGTRRVSDRSRGSEATRPLRPEHSRAVPVAWRQTCRSGRRFGHSQLA